MFVRTKLKPCKYILFDKLRIIMGVSLAHKDTSIHQFSSVPTALAYGIKNPNWWMIRSGYGTDVSQLPGWIPGYVGCRTCFRPQSYPQPHAWIVHLDMYPITFQCLQHILWYASYPLPHPSKSSTVHCSRCTLWYTHGTEMSDIQVFSLHAGKLFHHVLVLWKPSHVITDTFLMVFVCHTPPPPFPPLARGERGL